MLRCRWRLSDRGAEKTLPALPSQPYSTSDTAMHRTSISTRSREVGRSAPPEDRKLMQLVAAGDERARQMCAMRLVTRIRRVSAAILGGGPDVDDAIQESLIAIFDAAHGFRGESRIERWAGRISVRTALQVARKRQRHTRHIDTNLDPDILDHDDGRPASAGSSARWARVDARSELDENLPRPLRDYLEALPPVERSALVLRHALGHTLAEIAELTGTSQSTVKYRIRNALARARAHIRRDDFCGQNQPHERPDMSSPGQTEKRGRS